VKILLSAFHCNPRWGSEFSTGWNWAAALAELGHDVTVLTGAEFRDDILSADPENIDFRFIDFPASSLRRFSGALGMYETYLRWQDAALNHVQAHGQRYDVAHHVTWGGLHLGSQLWKLPTPLVYGPAGGGQTAPANYWRYFGRSWPAEIARTMSTGQLLKLNSRCRQTIRNSAVTLVNNSATAAAATRLGAKDVRYMLADGLVPSWIGAAHAQPTGTPVVLFIGRLIPRKAPTLAVEAFAELRRKIPARLVIAGDGPLRGKVLETIERLGVTDDVELLGAIPFGDVKSVYDSASVLLFPSLRESFGAPFLEALGRGLPAVALNHQGIADADVGRAAMKVDVPSEPQDLPGRLASAMHTVLTDGEWQSRSAAGIKWASDWVWPVKAAAATEIYREIAR
jgi:glycosyltransferase involved in cell wall biosynthesis